jgi:hypothetical protein
MGGSLMTGMARAVIFPAAAFRREAVARGLLAGSAWGVAMGIGLTALAFRDCGVVCLTDAALTTAISMAAGIVTLGPLAAWYGR